MGGALRDCGCFDGPFSEQDASLVSIRCEEHSSSVPPLDGYQLAFRGPRGQLFWPVSPATRVARMAIPRRKASRR